MAEAMTVSDAIRAAEVIRAAQGNKLVARLIDGEVFTGTARSVGTDTGMIAHKEDVRDCFLRVTLHSGTDTYWPMRELMAEVGGEFIPDYQR